MRIQIGVTGSGEEVYADILGDMTQDELKLIMLKYQAIQKFTDDELFAELKRRKV